MKLTFMNSIATIHPFGFLDKSSLDDFLDEAQIKMIYSKNVNAILLSLKDVVFFNAVWFENIVEKLMLIARQNSANFGVCDYNDTIYDLILKIYKKGVNFSLFESRGIARLFFSDEFLYLNNDDILVFNDRVEHKNFAHLMLSECGYSARTFTSENDFKNLSKTKKYAISSKTYLVMQPVNLKMMFKNEVVVYKINEMIDSEFIENFDISYYERLLNSGFEFFVFWVKISAGINIHGTNFMLKLASISRKYNALVSICGINEKNISFDLLNSLRGEGVLLYQNIRDFFDDDTILYIPQKSHTEFELRNITKNVIDILPTVVSAIVESLLPFYNNKILCVDTRIENLKTIDSDLICGCVIFDGDISMRVLVGIKKSKLNKISEFFSDSDFMSAYTKIFNIIIDKVGYLLISKGFNINIMPPKIFTNSKFYDNKSRGALLKLNIENDEIGVIFISK